MKSEEGSRDCVKRREAQAASAYALKASGAGAEKMLLLSAAGSSWALPSSRRTVRPAE
jgi:hypothetical protein